MTDLAELPAKLLSGDRSSFAVNYNDHNSYYLSVADAIKDRDHGYTAWVSEEEKAKAIEADTCWYIQWYPDTPIGFYTMAASSWEALSAYLEGLK